MEKRTPPVKEEERDVVPAAAGDIEGGEIGKFGHKSRVADRDFAKPTSPDDDQSDSSNNKIQQEDELKSTRAEVGEAREENERLKKVLTRIVKDYQALQMHFFDIVQQEPAAAKDILPASAIPDVDDDVELEPELVSLRLGTSTTSAGGVHEKEDKRAGKGDRMDDDDHEAGLALGLDVSKFGSSVVSHAARPPPGLSSDDSSEEAKGEEEAAAAGDQPWPPGKAAAAAKNSRSADQEEVTPQAHVKRARVSVRARCDTPTMNDGCQWRKYGQKVSKGNPCPRAYYRCTVAPLCPVRKQVQRCAEDMSILITTYEGTHNHPLPIAATAMASTTAAAACMLTSGSTSGPRLSGISAPSSSSSSAAAYINNPHGPSHFYLQNQLISPSSNSHPTITLDLTNKYNSSNFAPSAPRYPPAPTTFNFSSSIESNSMPSWTSSTSQPQPYNSKSSTHMYSSLNQAYWQRAATSALPPPAPNNMSTDTIARAITSDPSFQSALAAAITSYVGARSSNDASANANANGANSYGSSRYLNRSASLGSARQGGLMLLQPPMPVVASGPKSASGSPEDGMEQAD